MKANFLSNVCASALVLAASAGAAQAHLNIVGTIYGVYNAQCFSGGTNSRTGNYDCSEGTGYNVNFQGGNGYQGQYDTPALIIVNSGPYNFTNLNMTLNGYQADNNLKTASTALNSIASHSVLDYIWSGTNNPPYSDGNLLADDYDDEYGQTASNSACDAVGQGLCADVGNFQVKIAGLLNGVVGANIASCFSPTNSVVGICGNQQGSFVGWEGLNPAGWSESTYDQHASSSGAVLAYLYTGTTGINRVPEPATIAIFGLGLGALGMTRRKRKKA